jgi:hypothetical protein
MALTTNRSSLSAKLIAKNYKAGLGSLQMARVIYDFTVDGGGAAAYTPKKNVELPDNTVIVGGTINSTTAVTSTNACNVTIGTSAGSAANSILTATAKGSFSTDAVINSVATFATPVKLTAKGKVTISFTDSAVLGGVVEITLYYFVARN